MKERGGGGIDWSLGLGEIPGLCFIISDVMCYALCNALYYMLCGVSDIMWCALL